MSMCIYTYIYTYISSCFANPVTVPGSSNQPTKRPTNQSTNKPSNQLFLYSASCALFLCANRGDYRVFLFVVLIFVAPRQLYLENPGFDIFDDFGVTFWCFLITFGIILEVREWLLATRCSNGPQEPTRPPKVGSRTAREPPLDVTFGITLAPNSQIGAMMLIC